MRHANEHIVEVNCQLCELSLDISPVNNVNSFGAQEHAWSQRPSSFTTHVYVRQQPNIIYLVYAPSRGKSWGGVLAPQGSQLPVTTSTNGVEDDFSSLLVS